MLGWKFIDDHREKQLDNILMKWMKNVSSFIIVLVIK